MGMEVTPENPKLDGVLKRKILLYPGLVLAGFLGYVVWGARPLDIEREFGPAPPLPSPNGYDELLQAYQQILAVSSSFYRRNHQAVDPLLEIGPAEGKTYPPQVRAQWVTQSKDGFATFDRALKLPFQFPVFHPKSENDSSVAGAYFRFLAKDLAVKSASQAESGDHFGAAQSAIDAIQLGVSMEVRSSVIDSLYGVICELYGRRALTTQIAYLTAPQAGQLARRLETIVAKRPAFSQIVESDKLPFAYEAEVQIKAPLQKAINPPDYPDPNRPSPWQARLLLPLANGVARRQIQSVYTAIDAELPNADAPWATRQTSSPASGDKIGDLISTLQGSRFFYERSKTVGHQCLIRLALHAYRKTKGVYPQKLEELVPGYLASVPADTFAGAPMRYKIENGRYTLWSVGPDARDDGGRPLQDATKTKREARYLVRANSMGDIVANINS